MKYAQTLSPSNSTHFSLSELALDAAIELENLVNKQPANLECIIRLAKSLGSELDDLSLFPIYARALSSSGLERPSTSADVYKLVEKFSEQMAKPKPSDTEAVEGLRDFCVALHGALLSMRIDSTPALFRADEE